MYKIITAHVVLVKEKPFAVCTDKLEVEKVMDEISASLDAPSDHRHDFFMRKNVRVVPIKVNKKTDLKKFLTLLRVIDHPNS